MREASSSDPYRQFLEAKVVMAKPLGFEISEAELSPWLKPHIKRAVPWMLAGNYDDGRFGFCLDNVRPLICPLPLKSRQTPFWTWRPPADLDARLLPAVDHFDVARRWKARHAA